jgi:acyl-CoA thioesterase-1
VSFTDFDVVKNLVLYHVFSGHAFFSGAALVVLSVGLTWIWRGRGSSLARIGFAVLGLVLVLMSSTPVSRWVCFLVAVATVCWVIGECCARVPARFRTVARTGVIVGWCTAVGFEAPYHLSARVAAVRAPEAYVIGDSVSEGTGESEIETWPARLAREHGVVMHNLARVAATATSAMDQAQRVTAPGAIVIVEIGGNDVLGGTPTAEFERSLNALLARLRRNGHVVVMLELPLLPFSPAIGGAQRRLAARHGVLLVPKRVLVKVFTSEGATLDSIHLSGRGHAILAEEMWKVIRPAFR